jgi:hypothetical protein
MYPRGTALLDTVQHDQTAEEITIRTKWNCVSRWLKSAVWLPEVELRDVNHPLQGTALVVIKRCVNQLPLVITEPNCSLS